MKTDDYGQGVGIAELTDPPSAAALANAIVNSVVQRSVMRFASASARNAAILTPAEGMVVWLNDANNLTVYDGSQWLPLLSSAIVMQQSSSYDATTTTYSTASVAGTYVDCALSYVAPLSGKVKITTSGRVINSGNSGCFLAPETRTGGTIGSGTIVEGALDINGLQSYGNFQMRGSATHLLTGLTPGAIYNTRILHKGSSSAQVCTFAMRELMIDPST